MNNILLKPTWSPSALLFAHISNKRGKVLGGELLSTPVQDLGGSRQ